jgi:tetratricopeptide (TPR) repeat protein
MTHLESNLRRGIALHHQGRLNDAERVYQDVLREQPNHFDALHMLGVIALQTGRAAQGVALIERAIEQNDQIAAAHSNLGKGLRALNRHGEALASYAEAVTLQPDFAEGYYNLGNSLRDIKHLEEAVRSYDKAIALNPDYAAAHFNRGNAMLDLKRFEDAVASYDRAIALKPDYAEAFYNRGNGLLALNRPAQAHYSRGNGLMVLQRYTEAVASYDHAIALQPDDAETHYNRGLALQNMKHFEDSVASYDRAIALRPDYAEAHYNRGNALLDMRRFDAAVASFDRAIALKPDDAGAYWNQSMCCLALGDYQRGWQLFEWRWKAELTPLKPDLPWLGNRPIDGKTILVLAEQGLGDSLQFCRYVPMLAARATVILSVPRPLLRLLSSLEGVSQIVATGDRVPVADAWIPMMSLPLAFNTTLATVPNMVPYLRSNPQRSTAWRDRLAAFPGRKVGLVWSGGLRSNNPRAVAVDKARSITLQHFAPLAGVPGLSLISLQKGEPAAQTRSPPAGMIVHDWTDELNDFADTADLVDALDLVISVDTSVAHLAGALGKPVWVLNRYDQCWRWLCGRTDSPWYPSARLFRQRTPGDWPGVLREVTEALHAAAW